MSMRGFVFFWALRDREAPKRAAWEVGRRGFSPGPVAARSGNSEQERMAFPKEPSPMLLRDHGMAFAAWTAPRLVVPGQSRYGSVLVAFRFTVSGAVSVLGVSQDFWAPVSAARAALGDTARLT